MIHPNQGAATNHDTPVKSALGSGGTETGPVSGRPMRPSLPRLVITLTTLALALAACTTSPAERTPSNEAAPATTAPPAEAASLPVDPDDRHVCGQVSALQGILYRSDWEHDQGLIDETEYASRVAAVEDGWKYLAIGGTDIRPAIKDAQRALTAGGVGYDNTEFRGAMEKVARACDAAGSLIAIGALPGQGG